MVETLTIAQVAKEAGLPETTARRYANNFQSFFHAQTYGRAKKYPPEAVELVREIAAMYDSGKETAEIEAVLQATRTQVIDVEDAHETQLMAPRDANALAAVLNVQSGILSALQRQLEAVQSKQESEFETVLEELRALREEVAELKAKDAEAKEPVGFWARLTGQKKKG